MANVIVLGTAHHWHWETPIYSTETLIDLLKKPEPDLICAELSPEQLNGTTTCNSKPEYPKAIIPFAQRYDIPIIPLQPSTEQGLEYGNRKRKEIERIKSTPGISEKWEFWMDLSASMQKVNSPTLFDFLCRGYDTWLEIIYDRLYPRLFPKLGELWEEWNQYFITEVEKAIKKNPESRITVTVGNKHKYWLNNRLSCMNGIRLEHIQNYLDEENTGG
mgnify:CR=1 FL=1